MSPVTKFLIGAGIVIFIIAQPVMASDWLKHGLKSLFKFLDGLVG